MSIKTNPSRIPVHFSERESQEILIKASETMTLHAWNAFIGSLMDFPDIDAEGLIEIMNKIRNFPRQKDKFYIQSVISKVEVLSGIQLPYYDLSSVKIKNLRDLNDYNKKVNDNALTVAFTIIFDSVIALHLLDTLCIPRLIEKTIGLSDSVSKHEVTLDDICWALREEFGLTLKVVDKKLQLVHLSSELI